MYIVGTNIQYTGLGLASYQQKFKWSGLFGYICTFVTCNQLGT